MTYPATHPPPPLHPFQVFAQRQTEVFAIGLKVDTDPPQHLPAALALEGVLNTLAKATGTSPIKLTPTVAQGLQGPPHGLSERAVSDLKALLRKFQLMYGTRVPGPGSQKRYAPLSISDGWMFEAVPQFQFRPASPEQRAQAVQAEVERQAISAMSWSQRRRHHAGHINLPATLSHRGTIT